MRQNSIFSSLSPSRSANELAAEQSGEVCGVDEDWAQWPLDTKLHDAFKDALLLWQRQGSANFNATDVDSAVTETVCALGIENMEIAERYSALTGRRARVVESVNELIKFDGATVLIGDWLRFKVSDLDTIYKLSTRRSPIGLIVAECPQGLLLRAAISATLVRRSRRISLAPLPNSAVVGHVAPDTLSGTFDRVSGPDSSAEEVAAALNCPSAILGIVAHSDGVDARLSSRATLCPKMHPNANEIEERPANCDVTGYCHRRHLVRADALSAKELLSPRDISARVALFLSCYVARPADCSVDPRHGLMSQLLSNTRIGATVASWEVVYASAAEVLLLARLLTSGQTLGNALSTFYRTSRGAIKGCNRYLLFGDPAIRTHSATNEEFGPLPTPPVSVSRPSSSNVAYFAPSPIGWARSRLDWIARHPAVNRDGALRVPDPMLERAMVAMRAIEGGGCPAQFEIVLRTILVYEGSGFMHWSKAALDLPEYMERGTSCFGCGAPGRLFRLRTRFGVRWQACCTQCDSFYADVPEGSGLIDASFTLSEKGVIEHTLPLFQGGSILLNLRSSLELRTTWSLDESFDVAALPAGRNWLWLHALSHHGMFSFSRMVDNRQARKRDPTDSGREG